MSKMRLDRDYGPERENELESRTAETSLGVVRGWLGTRRHSRSHGVSPGAISQWVKRAREGGEKALETPHTGGRPAQLSAADLRRLVKLLAKGAEAFGFRGAVWNNPRVAELIQREFGIRYHPAHVSRILKRLGWTPQKPIVRAKQRNPEEIEGWWQERWPKIKKRSSKKAVRSSS